MTEQTTQPESLAKQGSALHKAIDFGFQVEAFLQSDIGKHLVARADEQVESAVEELKEIDPTHVEGVRLIQNRIKVAESIQYWLADAITSGHAAQDELLDQST